MREKKLSITREREREREKRDRLEEAAYGKDSVCGT